MTLQFGRLTGLPEPQDWVNDGDRVSLTGTYSGASLNAGLIFREQMLGYANNPDETVIPVISSVVAQDSGFYRVLSMDLDTDPVAVLSGFFKYHAELERVPGYQTAQFESVIAGALMTNALGITTTAEPFHAFGNSWEYTINVAGYTRENRSLADGSATVVWVRLNPTAAAPTYKALAKFTMTPANYYNAGCEIRNTTPSDHVVVGQQEAIPANTWTLRNGLVSLTVTNSSFWPITWADATNTYRTNGIWDIKGGANIGSWVPSGSGYLKIIRNSPEECIIRVPVTGTAGTGWPPSPAATAIDYTPAYIDVSIRRGSRIVRFYLVCQIAEAYVWGNRVAVASTAITGGNVWTANDANGNRAGIFSSVATTNDLANGRIQMNAGGKIWDFGVSFELSGTTSVNRDTIASQVLQYLSAQAERQQIIVR